MPRTPLWTAIRDQLNAEIVQGRYAAGDKLPTEAAFAQRFGVNRHTVRRALADLQSAGLVFARRGAGVFVAHSHTDYPLGRRVRFHQNLTAAGRTPKRSLTYLETRIGSDPETEALGLPKGAKVHALEGLSYADEEPIARFESAFPADRFPTLTDHLKEQSSVTRALAAEGVNDYVRVSTRIDAKLASAALAVQLQIREGDAVLRTTSVNADNKGVPVEYGRTWFAADRVTLSLTEPMG
ncbi:MAG: phosphonate metabolism transcriptional regulator PhnF [Devosiaceae bacterium]|nr:phosphonate metabolism transcriptional regulator PhnF [Devosiaceae bacterium MH13]